MIRYFFILLISIASSFTIMGKEAYILRLDDEIGSKTWRYTREALDEAQARNSDLLLVHLNTYGGSVVHADSIRTALLNYPGPVVAFVDNNAASAGALIALACDTVFMRRGASMGAATVVNGTDGSAMPDKYQSYMRAMMPKWRRDPTIAEAMVDTRVVVPGLIDSTRVLTFTTDEAIKWHYAEDKAESISEVLDKLDSSDYTVKEYIPTWLDHLIGFFTNPAVQAVGFPSAAAIIAAVLYFLPLYISGIASSWIILIFVAGIILVVLEMFVVPGFGITGIAGISCICIALILGLIEHYTFSITQVDATSLWSSLAIFITGVVLAVGAIWYLTSSHGPKWIRRHTDLTLTQQVKDGYIGVDMTPSYYVGFDGVAITDMRPAGKVEINGEELDAVAVRGFINAGTRVKVVKYENAQIYVKEI